MTMIQFRKKKNTAPPDRYELVSEIKIERPSSDVYPLLDLADPRYTKRQLGDQVEEVTGQPGTYHVIIQELPDAVFALTVTAQTRDREYSFACVSTPLFGNLTRSHEHYALEDLANGHCRLILTNSVEFCRKLSEDEFKLELMMLAFANESALEKIKVHAEQGVDAVKAMSSGLNFDLHFDDSD